MTGAQKIKFYLHLGCGLITTLKNWLEYLLFYFKLKTDFIAELRNSMKFFIRRGTGDMIAVIEDFYQKQYCPVAEFSVKDNFIVIDVGAHIGTFSLQAARAAENVLVLSYEPERGNFSQLLKNIELNDVSNIKAFNLAIWKEAGQQKFYYDGQASLGGSMIANSERDFYLVESVRLEDIFARHNLNHCDLLKIDVEGAEYEILFNLSDDSCRRIKSIYCELHNQPARGYQDLKDFFKQKGFACYLDKKSNIIYAFRVPLTINSLPKSIIVI